MNDSAPPSLPAAGFTLIEVLVALAVLATALAASVSLIGQSIQTTLALRDRTVALWVAQDRLREHIVERRWPEPDTREGTADMGDRQWRWREQVISTPQARMRRVEIDVFAPDGQDVLAHLVGFLSRPATAGTPTGQP